MAGDQWTEDYEIDSDLDRMELDRVHRWLSTDAYWALGRDRETVETAARHSFAHEVYARVGFVPAPNPETLMIFGEAGSGYLHGSGQLTPE